MEKIYNIWFSRIEISNKIKLKLLNNYKLEDLWNIEEKDLKNILGEKSENIISKILDYRYKNNIEKYLKYLSQNEILIISFLENDYPKKLLNIDDNPAYIFVRGNKDVLEEDNVAIVGAREATKQSKEFTRKIAKEISDKNVNIVSGLAVGIDKYAHLGSLDSKIGKTIAVLGTGLDDNNIYPEQNRKIFERILENGGAVVSEYIIGTKPLKYHFPARNRIISGLSDKIIIVEAKEKSGSLITAEFALEQGKDIYVVPGSIFDSNYAGSNRLLKEGAYLLEGAEDLFINY